MDKKFLKHLGLVLLIGFVLLNVFFWGNYFLQPKAYSLSSEFENNAVSYLDPESIFYLNGSMECYPLVTVSDGLPSSENAVLVDSLGEVRNDICKNGDNYVAAVRFFIDVPSGMSYSIQTPGEFCEYIIFVNGEEIARTKTINSGTPLYPSPALIDLPISDSGRYEIVGYIITPVNSSMPSQATILFGSAEAIHSHSNMRIILAYGFCGAIVAMLGFCAIQCVAMRHEKTLLTYILLCMAIIFRTLMTGEVLMMQLIPSMDYRIGLFLKCITMPIVLLTMVQHTRQMFPTLMPKRMPLIVGCLQILNFINGLTLRKFFILETMTHISYTIGYGLLIYVCIRALARKYPYCTLFGIGTMQFVVSGLMEAFTKNMPEPARHTQLYPLAAFTIIQLYIFAKRYAAQAVSEVYHKEELSRALEARRASENAFLNAQMKPHFLYNTLNTIADLCVTDSDKAIGLIKSLEEYCHLIIGIDNMEKTVPLSQEMQLVSAYTRIEKERFPSINFYTDLPIRMPMITIPPLTLQPLIENAIKHGVRKSDKPGAVTLRIRDEYDCVKFYVSDNGVGMDEETRKKLLNEVPKENKSVGIYNINKRLSNLYNTGLEVDSSVGLGTCISFTIPKQ